MARPTWHTETLTDAAGSWLKVPPRDPTRADTDLTNLDWLHKNKNLLRGLQLGREGGVRTEPLGCTEKPPSAAGGGNCLAKPPYSFSSLIFMAIEGSRSKCLPVKDIYSWILNTFPYYKEASLGWKNSVRHNLSLSKCFRKVQTDSAKIEGKGSLWCVEPKFRHLLIDGLRKNWCGQNCDTSRQGALSQILLGPPADELEDNTPKDTAGGTDGCGEQTSDLLQLAGPHNKDHTYSIVNIQLVQGGAEQVLFTSGPRTPEDGGCLELLVFSDHTGSQLDWCIEAMGLVEVDSEAREAARSLLHLAGIQY
ncbi:forkhead box protein N2-like [Lissotriton helveticus]